MPAEQSARRAGRPRTRPEGIRECPVYLTEPEIAAADQTARDSGISRAEWMRRTITKALKTKVKK